MLCFQATHSLFNYLFIMKPRRQIGLSYFIYGFNFESASLKQQVRDHHRVSISLYQLRVLWDPCQNNEVLTGEPEMQASVG